jgi:LL-diaminopimelate aminotransferase
MLPVNYFTQLEERLRALTAEGASVDVIRLDMGSPDLPPPPHVVERLSEAARQPSAHGYQPHRAIPALRRAWADFYRRTFGVALDSEAHVLPLLGSKEGIFHLMQALLRPGDVALVPEPGYMTYTRGALAAGAEARAFPLLRERNYLPDLHAIPSEVLARARILWLNYPHNPSGAAASREFLSEAVAFARRHRLLLCYDAPYALINYDGLPPLSALSVPGALEVAVEFNSLSKSHNMAGWRVGAALGQPQALQALLRYKTNADSGHFLPILEAAVAALDDTPAEWIRVRNEVYRQRRDAVVSALRETGWEVFPPQGAIYVWARPPASRLDLDALTLLERAHVSLTPGSVFGKNAESFLRFSLTAPQGRLEQAMQRLKRVS